MSTLSDEQVIEIVKGAGTANHVSFASVLTAPESIPRGPEAIEIKIVLTPGSFARQSWASPRRKLSPTWFANWLTPARSAFRLCESMRNRVSVPDPERLFAQADFLAAQPQQEDLRRAISTAYYGLFNFVLTAAADMVVGEEERSTSRYSLAYRSVDHKRLRDLCSQLGRTRPQNVPLLPSGGFGPIADFARISSNLQTSCATWRRRRPLAHLHA